MEATETKEMQVIKRSGNSETVSFDKILNRVKKIGSEHKLSINFSGLVIKVIDQLHDKISTSKIDELTAEQAASLSTKHPDYGSLASALVVSNLQKNTTDKFSEAMNKLYNFKDVNNSEVPLLSKRFITVVNENSNYFDNIIDHKRDYLIDYFGFKTLERAYLIHINKKIIERPQYMWLRVAICLHENDLEKVKTTYDLMSQKYFTHATPTLFNAGTPRPQLSSCFLIAMESDSVDGIFNTLKECANISKWAGGIGLHIHNVRGTGSHIRGTNGTSNGIIPMLGVFNKTARYIDQCVVPETYIYTKNGAIEIQNIKNSDYIYNSKGDIEKVDNILEHPYDGDIFRIETMHSIHPLEITPQHPILVMVDQCKGTNFDIIKKRIMSYEKNNNIMDIFEKNPEEENQLFQWKEAEQLTYDDMPIYVIPTYSEDNKLTWEDCYMYGIILGDGCLSNQYTNGYISMHTVNKRKILEFCKNYFDKRYIQYIIDTNENITRIRWNKTLNMPIRYSDIYDTNKEKYIASEWLNLPIDKSKYIVKGLIDTDGCINREVVFDSTSYNLIENMRFLLLKMGIPTSGYKRDRVGEKHYTERGIIENKKISYSLRIPQTEDLCNLLEIEYTSKFFKFLRYKNLLFTRIKSIVKNHYQGTLYDLQLKNTHNYMIHNGIIHNGGGKRAGSFAIYIEPHHPDIEEFLDLKKNHGDEELRARDLFYALWISDLFMERVHTNSKWSLFCPDKTPGLDDCYGEEYKKIYLDYESKNLYVKQINARDLWIKVLDSQMETGTPYMLYKDSVNYKSNQKNLGVIKSSNLCTEVCEYSNKDETAVCNLASIGLSKFIKETPNPFTDVTVYSKNDCNWCLLMKALLKKRGINYNEIILSTDEEFSEFKEKNSVETLPQLFDNGVLIGGYNKVEDILRHKFDYEKLHSVTKIVTENLNKIIDINFYPTEKTKRSNLNHRPIGIGVQGLADVFVLLDLPFESDEAKKININIFKTIYHAALEQSNQIAIDRIPDIEYLINEYNSGNWTFKTEHDVCTEYNIYNVTDASITNAINNDNKIDRLLNKYKPIRKEIENTWCDKNLCGSYSSFEGSPAYNGILQFDMWNRDPDTDSDINYDWNTLKQSIKEYGLRNSLLVAPMPTASTSQILGNNECFEPFTSNIYSRRTLAGEFIIVNKYLINDLINLGIWDDSIKNNIIQNKGSIQYIDTIPKRLKEKYKIVWEIPMKNLIDMSRDRGAYICQSQSLNLWMEDPTAKSLTNMHFYSWKQGLKTGIYYLRRKPRHQPQQFTIEPESKKPKRDVECDDNGCTMCSG